jgi:hypothetical protein
MASHKGLVLHVQVGNNSLYGFFNNPATKASAHFWAAKSGALEQYVDTDVVAWAQAAGNPNYLSVEGEGYPNEAMTPAQEATIARLLSWSAGLYGFPITGPVAHGASGFTQHCNLDGTPDPAWGNHSCPGPGPRMGQMPLIVNLALGPSKEDERMTSLIVGGQLHVWGVIGTTAYHWWQEIGPPAGSWHVETMPL